MQEIKDFEDDMVCNMIKSIHESKHEKLVNAYKNTKV